MDGLNVERVEVYRGESPSLIVKEFGYKFNLSGNAKQRLYDQIMQELRL